MSKLPIGCKRQLSVSNESRINHQCDDDVDSFENTCEDLDLCQQPSWFDQDPQNSVKCARSCMKQWTCGKGSTAAGLWRSSAGCAERASIHPSCRSPSALLHVAAQDPCLTTSRIFWQLFLDSSWRLWRSPFCPVV